MVRLLPLCLVLGACFSPDYPACHVACAGSLDCPDGYTCGADGWCARAGASPCGAVDAAGVDGDEVDATAEVDAATTADADPCVVDTASVAAEADGIFISGNASTFALLPVANISAGLGSTGLFRFPIAAVPAGAELRGVRLALTYAALSTSCQTGCGSCDGIDAPGMLVLHYARSDWDEASVDHFERAAGLAWGAPGASAALIDRSEPIAAVAHGGDQSTTLAVDAAALADLPSWRQDDRLSFLVAPGSGAAFVVATRENPSEGCGAYPAPTLEIDYCLPD